MTILGTPLSSVGNARFLKFYGAILIGLIFVPLTGLCMPKKSGLICMEIFYTMSRLVSAVAFYHTVILLEQERYAIHRNLDDLEGFKSTNECVDEFSKVNVPKITNELTSAVSTLDILHYTIWTAAFITILEFTWLIPCGETVRQSRKSARRQVNKQAQRHQKFDNEASNTIDNE